jgi:hypothetical protein
MESPSLARHSVSADVSEFARAELEAFVACCRRERPAAWARVEQLQRVCRVESPIGRVEPSAEPSRKPKPAGGQKASTGIEVVRRGSSYVVGGTDAKNLVSGHSTRSVQGSPNKGRLSVREVSRLVKRMKVAA